MLIMLGNKTITDRRMTVQFFLLKCSTIVSHFLYDCNSSCKCNTRNICAWLRACTFVKGQPHLEYMNYNNCIINVTDNN